VQSAKSLNDATVDFRNQVNVENIFHAPDGLLDIAVDNAETEMNSFREIKIKKFNENVCKKIDPIASIINAYKMAMVHKLDSIDESKYFTDEYLNRIFGDL
jgi:Phage terminase-like protein, large subunit